MRKLIPVLLLLVACTPVINGEVATMEPWPTAAENPPTATPDFSDPKDEWTFIILGSDHRVGDAFREAQGVATDSFVIVHVAERESLEVTMLPIARELWIEERELKINSIYRYDGFSGVADVVEAAFGLSTDAIFITDLENFVRFIDDIDGLKMTFEEPMFFQCRGVDYEYLGTSVFPGEDLLCMARDRAFEDGYFIRQERHGAILRALWEQLGVQIVHDPLSLMDAAISYPFVRIWPNVELIRLGRLAIRATQTEVNFRTVSLDQQYLELGARRGYAPSGELIDYHVQIPLVDLQEWVACALDWSCDE